MTTTSTHSSVDILTGAYSNVPLPAAAPRADDEAQTRIESSLDQLERLTALLADEETYDVPPLWYKLPAGFKLSIVIPAFNEERTIREILGRVAALPLAKEIIVVDDCSTDRTREILASLGSIEGLRIVHKPRNEGKGAALRTGFQHATGDVVIVQDADLEYDPRDIPNVIKPIVDGHAEVVYGSRFRGEDQQDPSFLHRLGNRVLTMASNLFTRQKLTDMETCYKAFRRDVIAGIEIKQDRFGFEPEITAKLARRGRRIHEVPIRYDARGYHEGKKIGIKDAFNAFYCIVRYGLAD